MSKPAEAREAVRLAADLYQVHATRLLSTEASAEASAARRLAAWLLRSHDPASWSFPQIGKALHRKHPNVLKFCRQVDQERQRMPWFETQTNKLLTEYRAVLGRIEVSE